VKSKIYQSSKIRKGQSWSWSYGCWTFFNDLCAISAYHH